MTDDSTPTPEGPATEPIGQSNDQSAAAESTDSTSATTDEPTVTNDTHDEDEPSTADPAADAALEADPTNPTDQSDDAADTADGEDDSLSNPAAGGGVVDDEDYLPAGQTSLGVGDEVVVDDLTMRRALEAILMVTDEPLPVLTLARAIGRPTGDIAGALAELAAEYTEQERGFDLREVGGGWRYYTRADSAQYVERFVLDGQQSRITQAALETLAVVAYKQPVSRARVSAIRGVNVDGVMRTLVARGLVEEAGADTESQATLYRTSTYFLERMGMQSLDDLPELAPYLPEMDDIEEELAAQSLPPTTSDPDAEPSTSTAHSPEPTTPEPTDEKLPGTTDATDDASTDDVDDHSTDADADEPAGVSYAAEASSVEGVGGVGLVSGADGGGSAGDVDEESTGDVGDDSSDAGLAGSSYSGGASSGGVVGGAGELGVRDGG